MYCLLYALAFHKLAWAELQSDWVFMSKPPWTLPWIIKPDRPRQAREPGRSSAKPGVLPLSCDRVPRGILTVIK
ncbi:hypothetical protein F5Y14DRAFT_406555 [Nemania sp. NC0429]|nr:hypothetical protein F5Y14DRAFT_406555 [Nemania sp. NC0429]